MNRFFRKGPPTFHIDSKYMPGDSDKYSAIERFFRRIAFNLGNSPSQTEVKIISCIPVDVTELQERINTLAHELNRELLHNEKLESQLKQFHRLGIDCQEPVAVNFVGHKKRIYTTTKKTNRKISTDTANSASTQSDTKSDNWFHPHRANSPKSGKTRVNHKVSNIINQTQITVTPKARNKQLRNKESEDVLLNGSYIDYYRVGGKRAGCDLDKVYLQKPRRFNHKPYNRDVGVGFCLGGDVNIARCCPAGKIESRGDLSQTHSFYDDRMYDLIPVKDTADKIGLKTNERKNKVHQLNRTIKKTHPIQKVKRNSSNHFRGSKNDLAFAKKCQRIYEEMEKRKDTSAGSETMSSFFAASADREAEEKENDALLLQIKDILQSLLGEVKTSQHAIEAGNINPKTLTKIDAIVQKDLEEQNSFNQSAGCNTSNQIYGWNFPPLACAQLYPVLLQNSPLPPFFTGCLHPEAQVTSSMSAKNSFDMPKYVQQTPMSSETERLIKEIYNTIALNGLLPNGVNSRKEMKTPSVECVCDNLRINKKNLEKKQFRNKDTHTQVNKTFREVGTSYLRPTPRQEVPERPNTSLKSENIAGQRGKMPHEHHKLTQEKKKGLFKRSATIDYLQRYGNYADDVESVYSEFEEKSSPKIKNTRIPPLLSNLIGKISRKIRCVNHRLHKQTYQCQTPESKTVEYLVPPNKNGYRTYCS